MCPAVHPLRPFPWRLALTSMVAALRVADAHAAEAPPESPPVAYRVTIDAPAELRPTLLRDVGLVRWQGYSETTDELLDQLAREAVDEARLVAASEGFFSARIDVAIDRRSTPTEVTLTVVPGEPTRIASVALSVTGPATTDAPRGTEAIAKLTRDWSLRKGDVFRQSAWSAAKARAVSTLTTSPYAAATIAKSEALIYPESSTADLAVELASGPPFLFGSLEITGLERYPESLVRNFSTIRPGDPYDAAELVTYLRRLNSSGYFASAQAAIDPETPRPDDATVKVVVIEAPTRRVEGGVGYSTDTEFRANASWRDVDLDGEGLQFLAEARLETKLQSASVRFTQPPNEHGWIGTYSVGAERTDIEGLVTRTAAIGTRWHTIEERNERALSATFYLDRQEPSGAPSTSAHALYAEYERYWRRADDLIAPAAGWMASVQAGGGIPGASTRGFGRVLANFVAWHPVGASYELQFRAQGGAVLAPTRDGIPSVLLFRTGGATTVRGYEFESLGVPDGDATVPGRYYAVFNAEATRWLGSAWGIAAFVDAGNAIDSLEGVRLALGYGLGLRVRTPLGPFRVDVAYGQDVHKVRLDFSFGLTF